MNQTVTPEQVIRTYLLSLQDPDSLVDTDLVTALEAAARDATDPIEKLKALAALNRASHPDIGSHEQDFVRHAKAWAQSHDIAPALFREVGVSDTVLRSAGLVGKKSQPSRERARRRGKSVTAKEITNSIVDSMPQVFTLADVAHQIGGSPMTIRKAVDELVSSGKIVKLGPTPSWAGRGRAPLQFRKA